MSRPQAMTQAPSVGTAGGDAPDMHRVSAWRRLGRMLSPKNISAIYVGVLLIVIFSLWIPETFLTEATLRTLLNNNAVVVMAAIGLVLPLAAGVINLAVGVQVGAGSIFVGWLLANAGVPIPVAIVLSLALGALIGYFTAVLVVYVRIESFIATLGVTSLLAAFISGISGGRQILNMPKEFAELGQGMLFGITYPVYVMVAIAIVLWYFLERTSAGRRIYAVGGNLEAARLSGVRTSRVIITTLVICGIVASLAGVLLTARLANADPTLGPQYLLPAFTAAFLGSTQFGGRFNIWGTVVSIYVLALGVKGLQLAGAQPWITDAFNGAALLAAVALAVSQKSAGTQNAVLAKIRRLAQRGESHTSAAVVPQPNQEEKL